MEAECGRSSFLDRLAEVEAQLKEAQDKASREKDKATTLEKSFDDLQRWVEGEKSIAAKAVVTDFKALGKYAVNLSDYFYSSFDILHRWAVREYPEVDFSNFFPNDNFGSVVKARVKGEANVTDDAGTQC